MMVARILKPVLMALVFVPLLTAQEAAPLRLIQTISLPDVKGRMDHMDIDVKGKRLFVAALENGSLEVVDLTEGKWEKSIGGFLKPQGVMYVPALNKLFVASGDDGMLRIFAGDTLAPIGSVALDKGANRLAYDARKKLLYVGCGGKDAGQDYGNVTIVDARSNKKLDSIRVSAHPAELLLGGDARKLFVFIPIPSQIQVMDTVQRRVIATWPVSNDRPGDAALDVSNRRLLVGTRKPAEMVAIDSGSGAPVAKLPTVEGMDGVYFDSVGKIIYVSGGRGLEDGSVYAYKQVDGNHYEAMGNVRTRPGAGTSFWSPELRRYFVAAPATASEPASVMVFEPSSKGR